MVDSLERFRTEERGPGRHLLLRMGPDHTNVPDLRAGHSLRLHFLKFIGHPVKIHIAVHPVPECPGPRFHRRIPEQGRRGFATRRRAGVGDDELHEFLALEEPVPDIVALPGRNSKPHRAAQLAVTTGEQGGVVFQRHHIIRIAVDVKNRHAGFCQWSEAVDRVVLRELFFELRCGQAIGTAGLIQPGPTAEIANGIDPGDAAHRIRMLGGPVVEHQPAAAAWQQDGLAAEPALSNQFLIKRREVGTPLRTAIGFADVHAGHGDAGRQKPFEHPVFTRLGKGGQRRRIPHPRSGTIRVEVLSRRKNDECGATIDFKDFSRQRQLFLRLRCVGIAFRTLRCFGTESTQWSQQQGGEKCESVFHVI